MMKNNSIKKIHTPSDYSARSPCMRNVICQEFRRKIIVYKMLFAFLALVDAVLKWNSLFVNLYLFCKHVCVKWNNPINSTKQGVQQTEMGWSKGRAKNNSIKIHYTQFTYTHCQTVGWCAQIRLGTLPTHIKRIFPLFRKYRHRGLYKKSLVFPLNQDYRSIYGEKILCKCFLTREVFFTT